MSRDTQVEVRRFLPAPAREVFACFADAETLARWLYAGDVERCEVESEFTEGGRYRVRMHTSDGRVDEKSGEWLEIVAGQRLRMSWTHDEETPTVVTFTLEGVAGGTWLTVTHVQLPPELDELYRGGWSQCLAQLERVLA